MKKIAKILAISLIISAFSSIALVGVTSCSSENSNSSVNKPNNNNNNSHSTSINDLTYQIGNFVYSINGNYVEIKEYKGKEIEVVIPSTINNKAVNSIAKYAFDNCTMKTINIPNSIKSVGAFAFWRCYDLKTIYYDGTIEDWLNIKFDNYYARPNVNDYFENFCIKDANGTIKHKDINYSFLKNVVIPSNITK